MSAARFSAAQAAEANAALALMLGWPGGWMPVYQARDDRAVMNWHRVGVPNAGGLLSRHVRALDELYSYEIAYGLPRPRRGAGAVRSAVLWVRVEGKEQLKRARWFKPLPTIVLQEGGSSRRVLIWSLSHELDYFQTVKANKRLAYKFGAAQKFGDPDELRVPAPGTFLRVGRSRPVPIMVSRLEAVSYTASEVVGAARRGVVLRDPPPRDAWLAKVKEGS